MMDRVTTFSPCRKYRYTLWRDWWPSFNPMAYLMVIGLNPSTADETKDDPTIRKCIKFAKAWGFGALCMTNLFAWRDTSPEVMKQQPYPIGPDNDRWLRDIAVNAGLILAAWGNHGTHNSRAFDVGLLLADMDVSCLTINKATGEPKHPLYVLDSARPIPFIRKDQ